MVHHKFITLPSVVVKSRELEGREHIINTPLLLSRHPKTIGEKERFWLEELRKRVRGCDATRR